MTLRVQGVPVRKVEHGLPAMPELSWAKSDAPEARAFRAWICEGLGIDPESQRGRELADDWLDEEARVDAKARRAGRKSMPDCAVVVRDAELAMNRAAGVGYKRLGADLRLSDLAERVCRSWGIPTPAVVQVRPVGPGESPDVSAGKRIAGLYLKSASTVYLLDSLGVRESFNVLGHELLHHAQAVAGSQFSEPEADAYGAAFEEWAVYDSDRCPPRVQVAA